MKFIIDKSDGKDEKHPHFQDLVSSLSIYNQEDDVNKKIPLEAQKDDSDYQFHEKVEFYVNKWMENMEQNILIPAVLTSDLIYSTIDTVENGYDRTLAIKYPNCKHFLTKVEGGIMKGFVNEDAVMLSVSVRTWTDEKGTLHITFVKNKGNHRFVMKHMVNPNLPICEHLCNVKLHKIKDYSTHEARRHHTEANHKVSQSESNKTLSGYVAQYPEFIQMMNWLRQNEVDYNGIIAKESPEAKDWVNIESVSGINNGIGNGHFKRFGMDNMTLALKLVRDICRDITNEKSFKMSALHGHALYFKTWSDPHGKKGTSPTWSSKEDLYDYFIGAWKHLNKTSNDTDDDLFNDKEPSVKLATIAMSGEVKDIPYLMTRVYFRNHQSISMKKIWCKKYNKCFSHSFGIKSDALEFLINKTDNLLKEEVRKFVLESPAYKT
tara:strand:+ start:179 stop:1483 length:1305 start_codon:yes stop_codon:yes gene_type:complete